MSINDLMDEINNDEETYKFFDQMGDDIERKNIKIDIEITENEVKDFLRSQLHRPSQRLDDREWDELSEKDKRLYHCYIYNCNEYGEDLKVNITESLIWLRNGICEKLLNSNNKIHLNEKFWNLGIRFKQMYSEQQIKNAGLRNEPYTKKTS